MHSFPHGPGGHHHNTTILNTVLDFDSITASPNDSLSVYVITRTYKYTSIDIWEGPSVVEECVSVFLVGAVRMHVCVLYVCGMCVVYVCCVHVCMDAGRFFVSDF